MSKYTKATPYVPVAKFHGSVGNSKIGKISNVNLIAGDDGINGRTTEPGSCVGCCDSCKEVCYARKSYRYDGAIVAHADNTFFARTDLSGYFSALKRWLNTQKTKLFRYHSHGEIPNDDYFKQMIQLAKDLPDKKHYVYTKRYDIINRYSGEIPGNLKILFSPPFTCKTYLDIKEWEKRDNLKNLPLFIYDDGSDPDISKLPHCPAVDKKGHKTGITCDKCQRCPNGLTTAVYAH